MMSPHVYEEARASAPIHVQILKLGTTRRPSGSGAVRVSGFVVRIFRDSQRQVRWGQRVSFTVPVINRERTGAPELSGTIHHDWERMGRSRWLEAFLEYWNGEMHLVRSQIAAIRRPTAKPICGPDVKGFICPGNV
jgi:hypothetical protein